MYYAHIREDGTTQTVQEHLSGTASRSAKFAAAFQEERRGVLLGMAHDIGKNSQAFQHRLNGGPKVDHATAGAIECMKIGEPFAACCVAGHHGGLPNFGNRTDIAGEATFIGRVKKGPDGIPPYTWSGKLETDIPMPPITDGFSQSFWVRMLYSCLVDADYLDTEDFMAPVSRTEYDSMPELLCRLNDYIKPWFPAKNQLNAYRCQILNQCLEAASSPRGIYSLTVPTGGGKTVASMAFALKHAVENGLERVIYVIPYTSIIEQNAKVFRDILGEKNVIEHHCNTQFDDEEALSGRKRNQQLASENWDAPVIVTTAVQFFESLYSNLPSKCRKLHNIANSVIIFDEAQMIPGAQWKPCVGVQGMYFEGYDFIHFCSMSVSTMLVEVIIRMGYALKRIKEGYSVKDSIPISLNREKHPKLATMLFMGHSAVTAINAGKVYFTQNPMAINYPEWIAFAKYSYSQLKWMLIEKPELKDQYIRGKINEELCLILEEADRTFDKFLENYDVVFH